MGSTSAAGKAPQAGMDRVLEGRRIPDVPIKVRRNDAWQEVRARELFAGKKIVVFSLPGAFTPTCSTAHVPRFNELAPVFRQHGIDDILCVSVNDPFVMEVWQRDQGAYDITFVADGNGDFTRAMGMLVDKREDCLGERSWRYAMLVEDGTVIKGYVEPDQPGDPYTVSDADTVLRDLVPAQDVPPDILMFTRPGCGFCAKAKRMLDDYRLPYALVDASPRMLHAVADHPTTPQVFIDGRHIGGSEDLERWLADR